MKFVGAGRMSTEQVCDIVADLLRYNREKNLSTAVQIAVKIAIEGIGGGLAIADRFITVFEQLDKSQIGLYHFLGALLGQLDAKAALGGVAGGVLGTLTEK